MKFEHTEVYGWHNAIIGMRNPMNSWNKIDSCLQFNIDGTSEYVIGGNDMKLMQTLVEAGTEHGKFMRMIHVQVQITAPLYWWKEMDTYKVGTTANSTSTMHKILSSEITNDCFETTICSSTIDRLESLRRNCVELKNETKDGWKPLWKQLIVELPQGWLQTRMWDTNYAVLRNIAKQRKNHKLTEWTDDFFNWMKSLPYAKELIFS